jgi:hypothetical protein
MKRPGLWGFAISLLTLVPSQADDKGIHSEFTNHAFGKAYATTVTQKALDASPVWRDDAESPPVSARKAIKLADTLRAKLVKDSKDFQWKRESAEILFLQVPDRCLWRVHYEAHPIRGGETGISPHLDLIVLMDGTILNPVVSDWTE